jgi:hypothetical protein
MTPFFRRSDNREVQPGFSYKRRVGSTITETVTVLGLKKDSFGIPHVRFSVAYERPTADRVATDLKVLALQSFVDTYRERVV